MRIFIGKTNSINKEKRKFFKYHWWYIKKKSQ